MECFESLREKFERNNKEISRLKDENRQIAIQMWEDEYKGTLSYIALDMIVLLFEYDNDKAPGLCGFKEEIYSELKTLYGLLECAKKYKLQVPELVWEIVCNSCACCGCEYNCSGWSCDKCKETYGWGYSSYCDE